MWKFLLNSKIRYASAIIFLLLLHYVLYSSDMIRDIDYKFYDATRGVFDNNDTKEKNSSNNTIIVNIDEKSLQRIGQWPWSRNILAQLVYEINIMNPASIAINMVFPELDRSSPIRQNRNYSNGGDNMDIGWSGLSTNMKDYDKLFMSAILQSNSTLSVYLHKRDNMPSCDETLFKNLRFQYLSDKIEKKSSILCNHKLLQQSIKNFGFINLEVDEDTFLRRVSFFMSYNGVVIPSFALATLLSLDKNIAIDEHNKIHFLDHSITMNDEMKVLLNFQHSHLKIISAIDVLDRKVDTAVFRGKIVLVGLSIVGLHSIYPISKDREMSNMEVQATFIENVLDEVLFVQPKAYQDINILISFLLSSLLVYFLFKRYYRAISLLLSSVFIGTLLYLFLFYSQGIYVSIGYFLVPFLHTLFFMIILFIGINIRDKNKIFNDLQQSHTTTVESFSLVVGMRDGETGEHVHRIKTYVKVLAEYLYAHNEYRDILTPKYISCLYEATPLHDIGKVGVLDTVLKKEEIFIHEEHNMMQEHPILAKAIIEKAMKFYDKNAFLEMAYNIAYYYHERWDGEGYPLGLKADNIPLEAQLIAIAEAYDTLLSKEHHDYGKAESNILEGRGLIFNPILVDAFIEIKDKFREIHMLWKDEEIKS